MRWDWRGDEGFDVVARCVCDSRLCLGVVVKGQIRHEPGRASIP